MKKYNLILLFLLGMSAVAFRPSPTQGSIEVEVNNIEKNSGTIRIGIFRPEDDFPDEEWKGLVFPVEKSGSTKMVIPDLPYGTYALAFHHDVNGNGKLDKNLFGVPKEPYAFSNRVKGKWRAPKFSEAKIELRQSKQNIQARLSYWKDL